MENDMVTGIMQGLGPTVWDPEVTSQGSSNFGNTIMQAYRRLITERRYEGDMVHCLTPESSTYPPGKERMMTGLCGVILRILSSKKHL